MGVEAGTRRDGWRDLRSICSQGAGGGVGCGDPHTPGSSHPWFPHLATGARFGTPPPRSWGRPSEIMWGQGSPGTWTKGMRPVGSVVKNLPANAGDTGSTPGWGRSHIPRNN